MHSPRQKEKARLSRLIFSSAYSKSVRKLLTLFYYALLLLVT